MDREALEHSLVRRLLDHVEQGTTDLADSLLEIPAGRYTSPERLAEEIAVLFLGEPLVLCLSGALPGPGSYRTVDLCGTPVLVTRAADGRVRAMANVCRHRGVRVVDGAGEARRFTCPFHAWVYDLEGRLVGMPVADAFSELCREEKGLVELPVAEGYGLVVGRLRPGPPVDIDDYLGPDLAAEMAMLDFATWEPYTDAHVHQVGANWKVTLDTFRENYHFDYLHRNTLKGYAYGGVLTFDAFGPHLRNCSAIRSIDELRDRPEDTWGEVTQHFSYQYQLFPNTSLTFDSRHIELWQILPTGPDSSEVVHTAYMRPGLPQEDQDRLAEMAPWICETVVDGEDFWVVGRTEPGLSTGLVDTVVFGRNEPALQHLHRGFELALEAARRTIDCVTDNLEDFRATVRDWCRAHVPAGWRAAQTGIADGEFVAFQQAWFQELRGAGYAVPHWPAAWGGGMPVAQQVVLYQELAAHDAPRLVLAFVAIHHAASTLLGAGTDEQRGRHLPAILDGEIWCQGFSEPEAGSDLAALRTTARREGDGYVVNGQKLWASGALHADWCLLLARTDPEAPKRAGISYFLLDMRSPGIDVRPIRQATGESHFCEMFLDDVRIPAAHLVGEENAGWRVAQETLGAERGMTMLELAERLANGFRWLVAASPLDDPVAQDRLAGFETELTGLRALCRNFVERADAGRAGPADASIVKLHYSELLQRMTGFGAEVAGLEGQAVLAKPLSSGWESGAWALDFIGSWEWTIPGGTSEIQRTIIGERGLGLPREPAAGR